MNGWELTKKDYKASKVLYERELVDPLNLENMFRSGLYCILTARDTYTMLMRVYNGLLNRGLDTPEAIQKSKAELTAIVRNAGNHRRKETFIRGFADWWLESEIPKELLEDAQGKREKEFELRNEIAKTKNAPGLGMKCASLFMRTCGYKNVAPIDIWMIKYLHDCGYSVDEKDLIHRRGVPKKYYLQYEKWLTEIAEKHDKEPGMYQLALWCKNASWKTRQKNEKIKQTFLDFSRLFVALKTPFFNDFIFNGKTYELRGYSPNFCEKTVFRNRPVRLRKGFSEESLWGKVGKVVIGSLDEIFAQVYFKEIEPRTKSIQQAKDEIKKGMKKYDKYIAFEVKL